MLIGILLYILFFAWALRLWFSCPALVTEAELESGDFRYRYVSTPARHWLILLGACLLFAALVSFVTYSIAYLIWTSAIFAWADTSWIGKLIVFLLVAGVVLSFGRLPGLRQLLIQTCLFFQRYQFFPPLPSPEEEDLVEQLARLPGGTLPREVEAVLTEAEAGQHREALYVVFEKLENVHAQLEVIARRNRGVVKMIYFGRDWELVDNQFRSVEKQMHANSGDVDEVLMEKACNCLHYAYALLTRYIVETSASDAEVRHRFKSCGFDVAV